MLEDVDEYNSLGLALNMTIQTTRIKFRRRNFRFTITGWGAFGKHPGVLTSTLTYVTKKETILPMRTLGGDFWGSNLGTY